MAIYKDKIYHEQNMNGRAMAAAVYNKFKEHLTAMGIQYTEWGFNGKWYTAESTHVSSFVPAWLQDLARRAGTDPNWNHLDGINNNSSYWRNGAMGRNVIGGGGTNNNNESPTYDSRCNYIYGGLTFTINDIRFAVISLRPQRSFFYTYNESSASSYWWDNYYGTVFTDTLGGIALVVDGTQQCNTQVGGLYENKSSNFWEVMGVGMWTDPIGNDQARFGCYGGKYDTWELYTINTEDSFFMGLRAAKPYSNNNGYNYISVGAFKISPFFDNTAIGDVYYLYPTRRVTKMDKIMSTIDISKVANLVTDRSIFNGQMHPMQGDKILGKSPIYNWYIGYDTWGMIGRINGIYGTVYNFGRDYVLLDGIQHQGTQDVLPMWFGNTNVLKV